MAVSVSVTVTQVNEDGSESPADGELAACTFTWGRILYELDEYVRSGSATPPLKAY